MVEFIVFRIPNKLIVVHKNIEDNLCDRYFISVSKFRVVPNGINPNIIEHTSYNNKDKFTIGYLGSLAHREGVDLLINHSKKLDSQKFKLLIIGGSIKEFDHLISSIVSDIEIEYYPNILYEKAILKLSNAHCFVHLRRPLKGRFDSQGAPLKMLDYLNISKPIIASDISSYKFIDKYNFGIIVDPFNSRDFLNAILEIKNNYESYYSRKAFTYVSEKFSWEVQIAKLDSILNA